MGRAVFVFMFGLLPFLPLVLMLVFLVSLVALVPVLVGGAYICHTHMMGGAFITQHTYVK